MHLKILNELVEHNIQLPQNSFFIQNTQFPPLKHMHKIIEQDCKSIHSLLTDGKCNEAITWTKQYFDNHLCKLTLETIIANLNALLDSCKDFNHEVILNIENLISHFNNDSFESFARLKRETILFVIKYSHVLHLVNAAASNDDVKHYLQCSH